MLAKCMCTEIYILLAALLSKRTTTTTTTTTLNGFCMNFTLEQNHSQVFYMSNQKQTNKKTSNKTSKDRKTHLYSAHSSSCRLFPKLKVRQIQHRDQIQMKVELQKLSSTVDSTTKEVLERYKKKKSPHKHNHRHYFYSTAS